MRRVMVYASVMMSMVLAATVGAFAMPVEDEVMVATDVTDEMQPVTVSEEIATKAFAGRKGGLVFVDCATGTVSHARPQVCAIPLPPCSTFKIWNTLIGLEAGVISSADEPFYTWDGTKQFFPDWERDLTLGGAFKVSCVPAFQALALKIGEHRMRYWLDTINYGDKNMSSGLDVFWLPRENRQAILISADQQAELLRQLVAGELPFSAASCATLKTIMQVRSTGNGVLYGKTGSSGHLPENASVGWFVGYVENAENTVVFACVLQGEGLAGKDARAIVEAVLTEQGLL